jgi:hypothetical protein
MRERDILLLYPPKPILDKGLHSNGVGCLAVGGSHAKLNTYKFLAVIATLITLEVTQSCLFQND